jgi:Ca2+-binding RTX toxin-like protein
MAINFATSAADTFTNTHHSVALKYVGGAVALQPNGGVQLLGSFSDSREPYNGVIEGFNGSEPLDVILERMADLLPPPNTTFFVEVFSNNPVDYSASPAAVFVDLEQPVQQGGFAQGDVLTDISEIIGTPFNDVIRGSNTSDYPPDNIPFTTAGNPNPPPDTITINNPGNNTLNGGAGSDVLEGRGGADVLNGGLGFDFASYESSPGAVTVRLPGTGGADTQTATATGADATGDSFISIEGLIGSAFDDSLTGNSLNNILAGGLGNDILDGKGGIDTADYSLDHFFDPTFRAANKIIATLGASGSNGNVQEFEAVGDIHTLTVTFTQISSDTLISIENITGTSGNDVLTGNEQDNVLDGRAGDDVLDGGLGNDTLIGGTGTNTVSYASHDDVPLLSQLLEQDTISLGLNNADGSYTRGSIVLGLPIQFQVVEADVLRGIQNVIGSAHSEAINGNEKDNILDGGLGNDTIVGGGGSDTVSYASHNLIATSPLGEQATISLGLNGADGSYSRGGNVFTGTGVHFQVFETDVLRGISNVVGSSHDETITGNEKDNIIDGGLGNDTLIGGGGNDTVSYQSHNDVPTVGNESTLIFLGLGGGDGQYIRRRTTPSGSQEVEVDFLRGFTNITGSNHDEQIAGNEQDNIIDGGDGNDFITGGLGNDILIGGRGNDTVNYSDFGRQLVPGEVDTISLGVNGADGSYTRIGTQVLETDVLRGFENIIGGLASETINGNEQANVLVTGGGSDIINGGGNNDSYDFSRFGPASNGSSSRLFDSSGTDKLLIGSFDRIQGAARSGNNLVLTIFVPLIVDNFSGTEFITIVNHFAGNPIESIVDASGNSLVLGTGLIGGNLPGIISGTDGNDVMDGRGGDDFLFGNGGNDTILGGIGNDRLFGGAGNDLLDGGPGNDRLIGGAGKDVFVIAPQSAAAAGSDHAGKPANPPVPKGPAADHTIIEDFTVGEDRIDLTAFHTSFGAMTGSGAGPVSLRTEGHDSVLSFDNGEVRIQGVSRLDAGDFIFSASASPASAPDNLALLGNYMAAAFPTALPASAVSASDLGPSSSPPMLAQPQHT